MPRSKTKNRFADFTFRFVWEGRPETPDECGQRTVKLLRRLKEIDPIFAKWHEAWLKERKSAGKRVRIEKSHLSAQFARGVWRDYFGKPCPENGYRLELWNTDSESHYTEIDLNVGSGDTQNTICIDPPYTGQAAQRVWNISVLSEIVKAVVESWEPERGELYAYEFSEIVKTEPGTPRVGWITYLSKKYEFPTPLPKPARVLEIPGYGSIIVTRAKFSFTNVDHRKHYKQLVRALNLSKNKKIAMKK